MVIRKVISLRAPPGWYEVKQRVLQTLARVDQERRTRNAARMAALTALHHLKRAFHLDESTLSEATRDLVRKRRKPIEDELRRIAEGN